MSTTVVKRNKKKPCLRLMERIEECEKTGQFKIDISHLELTELPLELNAVVRISQLLGYGNKFYSLPPLSNFRNLTVLDISRNNLTTLDTIRIVHLQNLTLLDVSRNMLDALPDDICRLPVLVSLICHRNKLTDLPNDIANIKSLAAIDASYNHIEYLGSKLENLARLETLNLMYQIPLPQTDVGDSVSGIEGEENGGSSSLDSNRDCNALLLESLGVRSRRLYEKHGLLNSKQNRRSLIQRALGVRKTVFDKEQDVIMLEQVEAYKKGLVNEFP